MNMVSGFRVSSVKKCQTSRDDHNSFFPLLISYIKPLAVYYVLLSEVKILIYKGFI